MEKKNKIIIYKPLKTRKNEYYYLITIITKTMSNNKKNIKKDYTHFELKIYDMVKSCSLDKFDLMIGYGFRVEFDTPLEYTTDPYFHPTDGIDENGLESSYVFIEKSILVQHLSMSRIINSSDIIQHLNQFNTKLVEQCVCKHELGDHNLEWISIIQQ